MPYTLGNFVIHHHERRIYYGKTNSMGDFSHNGQSKGKEGEKTDFDGLL
jgi:hypothetical protein